MPWPGRVTCRVPQTSLTRRPRLPQTSPTGRPGRTAGRAPGPAGRPERMAGGSRTGGCLLDDERRMRTLETLPPGHPSSPYLADGSRRPPPPRLRDLELPDERPVPDRAPPPEMRPYYWTQVPRFTRMWADHLHKWPKDKQPTASVDRSQDPPGSWRSDSNVLLSPENHARTKDAISGLRRAEPRVTGDLQNVIRDVPVRSRTCRARVPEQRRRPPQGEGGRISAAQT